MRPLPVCVVLGRLTPQRALFHGPKMGCRAAKIVSWVQAGPESAGSTPGLSLPVSAKVSIESHMVCHSVSCVSERKVSCILGSGPRNDRRRVVVWVVFGVVLYVEHCPCVRPSMEE